MSRVFKDLGTDNSPEYLTLVALGRLGEEKGTSYTQSRIVRAVDSLGNPPGATVQTGLRRLMEKGFVQKVDSRPSSYFITEKGWDALGSTEES